MENKINPADFEIEASYRRIKKEAEGGGYALNPDTEFSKELVSGLLVNEKRYGYQSCPCRLSSGERSADLDIICPCDYRDQDLNEYGACYCGLYVSGEVLSGKKRLGSIPERRPSLSERKKTGSSEKTGVSGGLPYPVWRCRVCGYLCARDSAPETCPICKVKKDKFERFI
ncbi:MAG TPA: ferredoxin:glutaredoxin reductase [Elusimicrobia bacterium]|nr:MAG: ferredoxin:glutaredoxin reductase [Elusimicrobia bacterium RIFOXYA1_FULL_47_7]OGS11626.1 MAG: ferredoxin:glutaredoxin reductase [Elusimicrobia bacterium RIFOXYB1_FULL_48_9]OGS15714.1 MAG: ferredoxin:glutaredoxin reductase [Elusimicrobia bacterium RIFOXYA2_FULL_47_53]OGS27067.1 MAG: ferredoxin:glutaredoxin reductase [Elusimicrobia bacterium RIFOXYB12_FULL_50_12]OGS31015.1 MAG: ferredoxin:glutaredoxin reductase [Elusimicrobia bacterium RIFOXYB2_FULL_46_23]HBU70476.1 ferredoxin:glutaredox